MHLKLNKTPYKSPEKIWTSPETCLVTIRQKRTKTLKLNNLLIFFKTNNFKVIENIRNQVKYTKGLRLPMLIYKGIKTCPYSFLKAAKENNKKRQQTKNQLKLARKRCQNVQAIFRPSKYIRLRLIQTPIM